jgi:hypothetical protein
MISTSSRAVYRGASIWALGITFASLCCWQLIGRYGDKAGPNSLILLIPIIPIGLGVWLINILNTVFRVTYIVTPEWALWGIVIVCSCAINLGIAWLIAFVIVKLREHKNAKPLVGGDANLAPQR